jgi:nitrite reductase/ring-hydroxylating ferredoxin subunit
MDIKFNKRNIFQRIFGIPATAKPVNPECWQHDAGKIVVDLKKAPELENTGGALRIEGGDLKQRVLVITGENDTYKAFQNRCTHMGHRRLDPVPGTQTVQCCSVNNPTYDDAGEPILGPAPNPIITYPVSVQNHQLIVDLEQPTEP